MLGDVYFVDLKGNRPGTPAGKWPDPQPAAAPRNTPETQENRRCSSKPPGCVGAAVGHFPSPKTEGSRRRHRIRRMQMADEIDGENGIVAERSRVLEASKF